MAAGTAKLGRCSFSAFLVLLLLSNPSCAQDASSSQDPATPLPDDTGELVQGKDPSMSASDFLAATQIAPDKIQTIRMRIYQQFVQNLAMQGASTAGLGEIVNLPQPPFTNMTLQLVKLRLSSLVANGFLFHEFFVPPGIQVSTNSELVVLLYNQIPVTFSPYRPPAGYSYTPYFAGIDILPFVNDSTQAPGPLLVRSSPSLPVTVTFPLDDSEHKFVQCTTFGIRGTLIPLNQSQDSTPTRIVCQSVTLGEFTLTIGSRPFPPPPPPPPSPPVSPPPPQNPDPLPPPPPATPPADNSGSSGLTIGLAVGLAIPIILLLLLGAWVVWQLLQRGRYEKMEMAAERAANLEIALIAGQRAPSAPAVRTRGALEDEA
ncbi:hypothetical protein CLOM_g20603 [Closterium sp. NIES-68]|nr:hypothetical protein CLOM_g20603 [Closterium sp. NIES-68]